MVNTETKRKRRFQQGLTMEIQDALVTARVDTYAETVEMAQRIEDSRNKLREIHHARRAGPKNWGNRPAGPTHGAARPPQGNTRNMPPKRAGGPSVAPPAKRIQTTTLCGFCGKGYHSESDCWKKTGKCLLCGNGDHQVKDCPRATPGRFGSAPGGSGPSKGTGPAGQTKGTGSAGKAKVPARVYAINKDDVEPEADVVEGTLPISGVIAKVLIDPGSSHSFARPGFLKKIGFKTETLPYWMEVSVPTGNKKLETDRICRNSKVEVCGKIFPADLISLQINGYDVILGMDWLARYYVQIDCRTKEVSLSVPGEPILKLNFKKSPKPVSLVSGKKARKLLWKGASGYLAYIVNQPKDKAKVGQVPVVRDFPDVFPEELNSLPPEREVEFTIDLLPEATPLSKTPYRMAPAELKELKDQLQELLKQGFIQPSTSP